MPIIDHPTEFVGHCEDTGKLRCGLLTHLIDLEHSPLTATRQGSRIVIKSTQGSEIHYQASEAVITALEQGAQFWVGNLEGSEEAWLVELL